MTMGMEEYFKNAVAGLRDKNLSACPKNPPEHAFSPAFEKAMASMIAGQRRKSWRVVLGRASRRAAGFALACLLGLGTCVVGVGAWSSRFFEMVEQKYPDHTEISFRSSGNGTKQTVTLTYTIEEAPEGFRRVYHSFSPNGFLNSVYFEDDKERRIMLDQSPADGIGISINTEGADMEDVDFWGQKARYLYNMGMSTLIWYDDKSCYTLTTDFPKEETMKIADTIRIKSRPYLTLQKTPLESLPEVYTADMARAAGDLVIADGALEGVEKLEAFVAACDKGQDSALRIVEFAPDGSALIRDLQMEKGRIYYTFDEHRWKESEQPWTIGEEYQRISIMPAGGVQNLLLYTYRYDSPKQVVQYKAAAPKESAGSVAAGPESS